MLTHPSQITAWKARSLEDAPALKKTAVVSNGTCGRASGSLGIIAALNREFDRRGLRETVGLEVTGCHGFCELEPNIVILPEGICYGRLRPEDIPAIIETPILKRKVIARLVYADPQTGRRYPLRKDIPFYRKQMRLLTEDNLRIDPDRIEDYILADGYQALHKPL